MGARAREFARVRSRCSAATVSLLSPFAFVRICAARCRCSVLLNCVPFFLPSNITNVSLVVGGSERASACLALVQMVDGFLPGMGAADPVKIPSWKVRAGTIKDPKVITRIDPVTGRPMDTSKPLAKRTGTSMGAPIAAAKPKVVESKGLKPLDGALEMSEKHGIHGATEPDPDGIWKSGSASQKVELAGADLPDDWLRTWKPPARSTTAEPAASTAGLILPAKEFVLVG